MKLVTKDAPIPQQLRELASKLWCGCDCDGRGCVICITIDHLTEIADKLDRRGE